MLEPAIGLHSAGQRRQKGTSDPWRLISTGSALMGSLFIVVMQECFGDAAHFLQRAGMVHQQAFFLVGAVVSLHVGILVWPMGGTDVDHDPQTGEKADQRRREIPPTTAADPARIPIKGEHGWQSVSVQEC